MRLHIKLLLNIDGNYCEKGGEFVALSSVKTTEDVVKYTLKYIEQIEKTMPHRKVEILSVIYNKKQNITKLVKKRKKLTDNLYII